MRIHDARKLDHATLEALRERAVQRVQEGESPEVVARVKLRPAPLHLPAREVLVSIVYSLELAAVDGDSGVSEKPHLATQLDKARAHLADGGSVVLT